VTKTTTPSRPVNNPRPARSEVLVDTQWLAEHLADPRVRVVEVDVSPKAFAEGHIDGAVLWNIYTDLKDDDYQPVTKAAVEQLVSTAGITEDSIVVFYGYGPALGFWLMKLYGHHDARILNASRDGWRAEGRPWTTDQETPRRSTYPLPNEDERLRASRPTVEREIGNPGCVLLDVRSDAEFRGERFWPSGGMEEGGRAGHVPGATNLSADGLYDARGAFLDETEIAHVYESVDVAGATSVISYCTIGGRASTSWFVLTYLLGHDNVRVYDGSWAQWGRQADAPVEPSVLWPQNGA
jgi:thiosulfate/3-mercaptopyruvate sulfurtransferase